MVRVLQISDTHLSPEKRHFESNWAPLRAWIEAQRPDLVIHTGDVTVDGADQENDARYCAELLRDLRLPALTVPGNHDIGDAGNPHQPVNAARLARWRRHFGQDFWRHDLEQWRLIGLNAMLFGSGEPDETRQLGWLEQEMAAAGDRRIAWFMHRPLFLADPREGDTGYWSVKPQPRARLIELAGRYGVALIASGHLHKRHDEQRGATRYIWAPSSGFVVGPALQPEMAGESRLGAVVYEFEGATVSVAIREVEGLVPYRIDDVVDEVYPPRAAA